MTDDDRIFVLNSWQEGASIGQHLYRNLLSSQRRDRGLRVPVAIILGRCESVERPDLFSMVT